MPRLFIFGRAYYKRINQLLNFFFLQLMGRTSPTGKFIFTSWEVAFMMSGAFKSLLSELDHGGVHALNKLHKNTARFFELYF